MRVHLLGKDYEWSNRFMALPGSKWRRHGKHWSRDLNSPTTYALTDEHEAVVVVTPDTLAKILEDPRLEVLGVEE